MAAKKKTVSKRSARKRSNVIELRPVKQPRKKRPAKKKSSSPKLIIGPPLTELEVARLIKHGKMPDLKLTDTELEAIGWTVKRRHLDERGRPIKRRNTEIRANERRRFARRKKKAEAKRNEYGPQAQAERATATIIELSKHRKKKT